ncbi:MAG: hypothetical protein QNK43_13095 [Amphritea sp.]|nr:hypothetical protein [Amphritea sp.]
MTSPICDPGSSVAESLQGLSGSLNRTQLCQETVNNIERIETREPSHVEQILVSRLADPMTGRYFHYVHISLERYNGLTLHELGDLVDLSSAGVVDQILRYRNNRRLMEYLYYQYAVAEGEEASSESEIQLSELRSLIESSRNHRNWRLRGSGYLTLGMSEIFYRALISSRTQLLGQNAQSTLTVLDQDLRSAVALAEGIKNFSEELVELLEPYQQDASVIGTMSNYLDIVERFPATPITGGEATQFDRLQGEVSDLKDASDEYLIGKPTRAIEEKRASILAYTDALFAMLETDSRLVRSLDGILGQQHLVNTPALEQIFSKLTLCYNSLAQSPRSSEFIRHGLIPVLRDITSSSPLNQHSALARCATGLEGIPHLDPESATPASLLLSVINASMPKVIELSANDTALARTFNELAGRLIVQVTGVSDSQARADIIASFTASDARTILIRLRSATGVVNLSLLNTGRKPIWIAVVLAVVNAAIVLNAFCQGGVSIETLQSSIDALALNSSVLVVRFALETLQRLQMFVGVHLLAARSLNFALATVGSLIAVYASGRALSQALINQDSVAASAALFSLMGNLLAAGVFAYLTYSFAVGAYATATAGAAVATVEVPPVALGLLFIAALLGAVGVIITLVWGSNESTQLFEAFEQSLEDAGSAFQRAGSRHWQLLVALRQVVTQENSTSIPLMTTQARPLLVSLLGLDSWTPSNSEEQEQKTAALEMINAMTSENN